MAIDLDKGATRVVPTPSPQPSSTPQVDPNPLGAANNPGIAHTLVGSETARTKFFDQATFATRWNGRDTLFSGTGARISVVIPGAIKP